MTTTVYLMDTKARIERAVKLFEDTVEQAETVQALHVPGLDTRATRLLCLDLVPRHAMAIAMWNASVCNGGIDQWLEHGYACTLPYLLYALAAVGTPNAKRVADMATAAAESLDVSNHDDYGSHGIRHLASYERDEDEDGPSKFEKLDDEYYSFSEDFMNEAASRLFPGA